MGRSDKSGTPPPAETTEDGFAAFSDAFDYDAFEEELIEDPPTDPQPEDTTTDGPPEPPRRTFDRRQVPKGDATFKARSLGPYRVVAIRGRMNESFPSDEVCNELRGPSVIDLRDVDRVSSFGVRGWLQMMQKAKSDEIYLSHCSDAIVNQITMMRNFCGRARIHSFLAPYVCDSCGVDFGVFYHAVDDRKRIEARRPAEVPCPDCGDPTEMDEDPFTYFDLIDHLVVDPPAALGRAIGELDGEKRTNPIEIEIDGDRTVVRFHEAPTPSTRFSRVFKSVEGPLTIDLGATPVIDDPGAEALVEAISRLDRSVPDVRIEGSPDVVTLRLLDRRLDRVRIRSLVTPMVDLLGGKTLPTLVDLEEHGQDLAAGRALSLALTWAKGQVKPANEALIARVLLDPHQIALTAPPVARVELPPVAPVPSRSTGGLVPALLVLVALLAGGLMTMVLYSQFAGTTAPPPVVVEQPQPAAPVEWSTGGSLPPGWSEVPVLEQGNEILVVGRGTGADAALAGSAARADANLALGKYIAGRLARSPVALAGIVFDPSNTEQVQHLGQSLATLGLLRREEAIRARTPVEVVARYAVDASKLSTWQARASFRGIQVAPAPPWQAQGVHLLSAESWFAGVSPGDRVLDVGGVVVTDLPSFERETTKGWEAVPPGQALGIGVEHQGKRVALLVRKPAAVVRPAPAPSGAPELMPLGE